MFPVIFVSHPIHSGRYISHFCIFCCLDLKFVLCSDFFSLMLFNDGCLLLLDSVKPERTPFWTYLTVWNVNPAPSLTSPLIFASFLPEQGLSCQADSLFDQLEAAERARPVHYSARVLSPQGLPDLYRYSAARWKTVLPGKTCRPVVLIYMFCMCFQLFN